MILKFGLGFLVLLKSVSALVGTCPKPFLIFKLTNEADFGLTKNHEIFEKNHEITKKKAKSQDLDRNHKEWHH